MLIWLDPQQLPWSAEERAALAQEPDTGWLLETFPPGVHARPDGSGTTLLVLFNYDSAATEVVFPLPEPAHYAEIALRGMSTMVPALVAYAGSARPHRRRLLHQDAREPAADRPLAGRGRLYFRGDFRVLGSWPRVLEESCWRDTFCGLRCLPTPRPSRSRATRMQATADFCRTGEMAVSSDGRCGANRVVSGECRSGASASSLGV